jgi:hypothetical protein
VYGPAIQAAIGTRLSEAESERLSALLGTFLERAKSGEARSEAGSSRRVPRGL